MKDHGAIGDGVTDDTASLQAALTLASAAVGGVVYSPPSCTYLVSSSLAVGACRVDLQGSTIKKKSTMTTEALTVTGAGAKLYNVRVDGNRSGGATDKGIVVTGAGVEMHNCFVTSCKSHGILVYTSGGSLTCYDCESDDNVSGAYGADGFDAASGGVLKTYNCIAKNNDRAGFMLDHAGDGCHLDGYAERNSSNGMWIYGTNAGTIGRMHGYDNGYWDLLWGTGGVTQTDWTCDTLISENNGHTSPRVAGVGAGVYIDGQRVRIGQVLVRAGIGWPVIMAPGLDCSIGTIIADFYGSPDTEPCVSLQSGSKRNQIGKILARNYSLALTISEENGPFDNDYNTIGEIQAYGCNYGVVSIAGGSYNRIGKVIAYDCSNTGLEQGIIHIGKAAGATASQIVGNVVDWVDHHSSYTSHALSNTSICTAYFESTVSKNYVMDGIARGALTDVIDLNGGNFASLRPLKRVLQISSFDTGGWVLGAADSTAGHFIEGTKGYKATGTTGYTVGIAANIVGDFSAMSDMDWFRVTGFIANLSDQRADGISVALRFRTNSTNYFQSALGQSPIQKEGLQNLFFRKGSFQVTGSPNWNNITDVFIYVGSAGALTFAITFSDLVQTEQSQFGNSIGATTPFGGKPGDIVTATGKIWSNDAGTWKSAAIA